jgi:hypothetical protein
LRRDHDFPCAVRGPVDREALRRLAAALQGEVDLEDVPADLSLMRETPWRI